jgi:hypothetical protein
MMDKIEYNLMVEGCLKSMKVKIKELGEEEAIRIP